MFASIPNFKDPKTVNQTLLKKRTVPESRLEDFHFVKQIGEGGFGSVFKALREGDNTAYAVKRLSRYKSDGSPLDKHNLNELLLWEEVDPEVPFITRIHSWFCTSVYFGIVLELVEGGDLHDHVVKSDGLPEDKIKRYASEIAQALEHLHRKNIIFRDLKLANVLLTKDDHVKLTDFGLATKASDGSSSGEHGTVHSMAPEMVWGLPYTKSIDWWGLGVLMYQMATCEYPFDELYGESLQWNIMFADLDFPEYVSYPLRDVIRWLCRKHEEDRPSGLEDLMSHEFFLDKDKI